MNVVRNTIFKGIFCMMFAFGFLFINFPFVAQAQVCIDEAASAYSDCSGTCEDNMWTAAASCDDTYPNRATDSNELTLWGECRDQVATLTESCQATCDDKRDADIAACNAPQPTGAQSTSCEGEVATLYESCTDTCSSHLTTALAACGTDEACKTQANSLAAGCVETCNAKRDTALAACGGGGAAAGSLGEQYEDIRNQGLIFAGICESREAPCDCRDEGRCTLEDLLQVVVNISVFVLGITGSLTLLILFYGGILWITAHGNPAMVDNGKKAIIGAAIGLAIVFGAYAAITLLVKVLTQGEVTGPGETLEDVVEEAVPGSSGVIETGTQ